MAVTPAWAQSHYTYHYTAFWAAAGLCIAALLTLSPARANTAQLLRLDDAKSGSLLFESEIPGQYVPAPRLATDVQISISGPIARTQVTQRFENISDGWVEGTYVFPLPDGAAVDTLKMQIGTRFIEGVIEERKKAKAIYEQAKQKGKKASLLEQQRPNLFTNAVANIGPGETVVVQIEYQETVQLDGNEFSLRFPMVVGHRYNPAPTQKHLVDFNGTDGWGTLDPVPDRDLITSPVLDPATNGPINPVTLSVDLRAGFPLGDVTSSFHDVTQAAKSEDHRQLRFTDETVPADRDFELTWTPKAGSAPSAALFQETVQGEGYYLVMLTPPALDTTSRSVPRDVTFVIDTSGSMQGTSIRQARESLALAINRLQKGDQFNIIQFNSHHDQLFSSSQPVTDGSIAQALTYVRTLEAGGGTNMLPALVEALSHSGGTDTKLRQVVFLTDGAIGNEQQLFNTIAQQRGAARIFTIGIGSAPNSYFMSHAAEIGQGSFTHIGDLAQVKERMTQLLTKLEKPSITNVTLDWPEGTALEAWPAPVPDLYHGETLVIAAKADAGNGAVIVRGKHGEAAWQVTLPLDNAANRNGIAKLWARKKIHSLEVARAHYGADTEALDQAVLQTALTHALVSRLTSLVAVDQTPSRPTGVDLASTKVPLTLPQGWDFGSVFGEKVAPAMMQPAPTAAPPQQVPPKAVRLKTADAIQTQGIALPKTATLWQIKVLQGLALLLFSMGLIWQLRHAR